MHFALIYGSVGMLAVLVFGWRLLLALRGTRFAARWAVAVAIACAALGFEAAVPQVYEWIGRVSGSPNLATLIVYSAITTATLAQLVWTTYLVAPHADDDPGAAAPKSPATLANSTVTGPNIDGRIVILINLVIVLVLIALFFAAPVHDRAHATDFDYHYATVPLVDLFLGIYLCAYTLALLRIVLLCRTWIPHVREQPWLRRGLVLLVTGSVIAIGYSIGKTAALAGSWAGYSPRTLNMEIAPAFASAGAAIMLLGYLCPSLLPQAIAAVQRARALPRLRPLWLALRAAVPERGAAAPVARRMTRDRLYRRVIEIRDALLLLQPHLGPEITAEAVQVVDRLRVPVADREAAVEAARIALALRAHRAGAIPIDRGEIFRRPARPTFIGELTWLGAVSSAYRRYFAADDEVSDTTRA
ncbi:MAB_1171c family putative transporter [Nocardia acidivorans]|uniref:MAB_1171c family putative transporter n=1 Tax=Nocardia acidivorans TaxID=404580 RepID=UPI00082E8954|nr:MAB_1171c family putative transporter [Nocardia acidivorans]